MVGFNNFCYRRDNSQSRVSVSRANSNITKSNAKSLIKRPSVTDFAPEEQQISHEGNVSQQDHVDWLLGSSSEDAKATIAEPD